MTPYDYIALAIFALVFWAAVYSVRQWKKCAQLNVEMAKQARRRDELYVELELQAEQRGYCTGWLERGSLEECLRVEQAASVGRYMKGMAN